MSPDLDDDGDDLAAMIRRSAERDLARYEAERPERVAFFRSHILPTYVDQWPAGVHALSVRSAWRPFPTASFQALHDEAPRATPPFQTDILARISELHAEIGPDAFFRLGSRSPKDWWYGHPQLAQGDRGCTQPPDATADDIACSFAMSERVMDDVFTALDADYAPVLCARAWVDGIEPHREFRCFMQDRELAGISVYRAWEPTPLPQIVADPDRWASAIGEWFPQFAAVSPLDDIVFDVVVLDNRVVLLEVNPAIGSTYPGHFLNKPFDGRFRYLGDGDSSVID